MEKNVVINDIYQNSLIKICDAIKKINIELAEDSMEAIKNQFNTILDLLKEYQNKKISMDSIKLLKDISFDDFLADKYIIEAVSSNNTLINESNIFIRKISKDWNDKYSFFRIIKREENYIAIRYCKGKITEEILSLNELNSFISLDRVLNDSEYIGYIADPQIFILYSGQIYKSKNYFTLYKKDDEWKSYVTFKFKGVAEFSSIPRIASEEERFLYTQSESFERHITNEDGIADRKFIVKVIDEELAKRYGIPEEEKEKSAVLTLKSKNNN